MQFNEKFSNARIDEGKGNILKKGFQAAKDKYPAIKKSAEKHLQNATNKTREATKKVKDFGNKAADKIVKDLSKPSTKGATLGAGVGAWALRGKLDRAHYRRKAKHESLGNRLLEKLDRLIHEEDILDKKDGTEEFDVVDKNQGPEDKVETSETLKKLQGHLLRFQERDDNKDHAVAGAALAGGIAGRQAARYAHGEISGANKEIKALKAAKAEPTKNYAHFQQKALDSQAKANTAKAVGKVGQAQRYQKAATAAGNAANAAKKQLGNINKGINAAKKTMNAAGRSGLGKGALIAGVGTWAGKKAYDRFHNK